MRELLRGRNITPRIARKNIEWSKRLGRSDRADAVDHVQQHPMVVEVRS